MQPVTAKNAEEQRLWEVTSLLSVPQYRPADWRYRLAMLCKDLPQAHLKKINPDKPTRDMIRLYKYLEKELTKSGPERSPLPLLSLSLSKKFSDLGSITALMYSEGGRDVITDLQCFILARADDDLIRKKFQLTQGQIDAYRSCYFDVADRLDNPHYIVHYVIFPQDKYNFVDSRAVALFLCYFNGLDAFYFLRHRSGLTKYVYKSGGVEPTDGDTVINTLKWKSHFLLESVSSVEEFSSVVKVIKDFFSGKTAGSGEPGPLLAELYQMLRFSLKVKDDPRLLQGDPNLVTITQEVYQGRD